MAKKKKNPFQSALADAKKDILSSVDNSIESLKDAGEGAAGKVAGAAGKALSDALRDPSDVPGVAEIVGDDFNFRHAASNYLAHAISLYSHQASEAISSLSQIGVDVSQRGAEVLAKMSEVASLVAQGKLSPESGERAVALYAETLRLVGEAAKNKAKVEAYKRAQRAMNTAKSLLFTGLRVALMVGTQGATAWLGNLPTQAKS